MDDLEPLLKAYPQLTVVIGRTPVHGNMGCKLTGWHQDTFMYAEAETETLELAIKQAVFLFAEKYPRAKRFLKKKNLEENTQ